MAEPTPRHQWDVQGLAIGLAIAFVGLLLALGRTGGELRPVHLLGVIVLAVGAAYLVDAVDRNWASSESDTGTSSRDDVIQLP